MIAVVDNVSSTIVAEPAIIVHVPSPGDGSKAVILVKSSQRTWSSPASTVKALLLISTTLVEVQVPFNIVQRKEFTPEVKLVTPEL